LKAAGNRQRVRCTYGPAIGRWRKSGFRRSLVHRDNGFDLRNQQRGSVQATSCKGSGQFSPTIALAAFNLGELGNQLPLPPSRR
jgi:hypothetical protein